MTFKYECCWINAVTVILHHWSWSACCRIQPKYSQLIVGEETAWSIFLLTWRTNVKRGAALILSDSGWMTSTWIRMIDDFLEKTKILEMQIKIIFCLIRLQVMKDCAQTIFNIWERNCVFTKEFDHINNSYCKVITVAPL